MQNRGIILYILNIEDHLKIWKLSYEELNGYVHKDPIEQGVF